MATIQELLSRKPIDEIFAISPDARLSEAATLMIGNRIGVLVVRDLDGPMIGVLSERDIIRAVAEHAVDVAGMTVADLATQDVETCTYKDGLIDVAKRMRKGQFRHMPVTDGSKLIGLVSMTDIFRYYIDYEPNQQAKLLAAYYVT